MHKSKLTILIFLMLLVFLFSGCASEAETPEITVSTESTIVSTQPTAVPTAPVVIPETTAPVPFEKTAFILETIDGVDYCVMNEFRYASARRSVD